MTSSPLGRSVRGLITTLALVTPLLTAGSASAWAIRWSTSYDSSLAPSDTFTVDLVFDADPGLQLLSIGVLWDAAVVSFDAAASTSPDIILESPSPGPGEAGMVSRHRDPWVLWPGDRPPGFDQVNVDYATPFHPTEGIQPAAASGNGISLGSLVFHVDSLGDPLLLVTLEAGGNIIFANNVSIDTDGAVIPTPFGFVDVSEVSILLVPEPRTAMLAFGGLLAAIYLGRRRGLLWGHCACSERCSSSRRVIRSGAACRAG